MATGPADTLSPRQIDYAHHVGPNEPSEQVLIQDLYSAVRATLLLYGSQNNAARTLGVSPATLTRASPGWINANCPSGKLPRPQRSTLEAYSKCANHRVRQAAQLLLSRRG